MPTDTTEKGFENLIVSTITRAKGEIQLINEYRTRLISDVVTGKLDVREVTANLPEGLDNLEEQDAFDNTLSNEIPVKIDEKVARPTRMIDLQARSASHRRLCLLTLVSQTCRVIFTLRVKVGTPRGRPLWW